MKEIYYLGPAYTFHHEVYEQVKEAGDFGVPVTEPSVVCTKVQQHSKAGGILAFENKYAGPVLNHLDAIWQSKITISGIHTHHIQHQIWTLPGCHPGNIHTLYSHLMALRQCSRVIEKWGWKTVPASSTAAAVEQLLQEQDAGCAVICSEQAGKHAGLECLLTQAANEPDNQTRFALLVSEPCKWPDHTTKLPFFASVVIDQTAIPVATDLQNLLPSWRLWPLPDGKHFWTEARIDRLEQLQQWQKLTGWCAGVYRETNTF